MFRWDEHSIGLVLTGGGAKGAYEIGCWKALSKAGICFDAVSGTSIGGINAFLVCRGDVKAATNTWLEMGASTPLPLSVGRLLLAFLERYGIAISLAIQLFVLSFAIRAIAGTTIAALIGIGAWLPRAFAPLSALLPPLAILLPLTLARFVSATRERRYSVSALPLRDLKRYTRHEMPTEFGVLFGIGGLATPAVMLALHMSRGASRWWLLLLAPTLGAVFLSLKTMTEFGVTSLGNLSLLSSERLEALLVEQIDMQQTLPTRPALYVARLREQEMVNEIVLGLEYVALAGRPMQEVAECLMSTSAIAGVLPMVVQPLASEVDADRRTRIRRTVFYDAGWIDNTPIAPLLERERCDVVIVVYLDHEMRGTDIQKAGRGFCARNNDSIRAANADLGAQVWEKVRDHPLLTPIREAPARLDRVHVIPIIPSEELGKGMAGFLRETLWFRRSRVRYLMALGERDAAAALAAFHDRTATAETL